MSRSDTARQRAPTVLVEDRGDGWWEGPHVAACEVCWPAAAALHGLNSRFWLIRLNEPGHAPTRAATFEYLLVLDAGHDLASDEPFVDFSVPMYPLLRPVEPGDVVSFDGDLVTGIKATIRRDPAT